MSTVSDILRHECMVLGQVGFISLRPTSNIKQFTLQLIKDSALEIFGLIVCQSFNDTFSVVQNDVTVSAKTHRAPRPTEKPKYFNCSFGRD